MATILSTSSSSSPPPNSLTNGSLKQQQQLLNSNSASPTSEKNNESSNNTGSENSSSPENSQKTTASNEEETEVTTGECSTIENALLDSFRALFDNLELLEESEPIQAYILPRTDAHNNEYICDSDSRVKFLTGFSGSSAYAIVTRDVALLWTDGRYFIQAQSELFSGWTTMKLMEPGEVKPSDWLVQNLSAGTRVGFDPTLFSFEKASSLIKKLAAFQIAVVPISRNLVDLVWADRPSQTPQKLFLLSVEECGEEITSKLKRVRAEVRKQKCDSLLLSRLDDIAWLLNLRGMDIPFTPVFFSYAFLVTESEKAFLFVDLHKLNPETAAHLKKNCVEVFDYHDIQSFLREYHETCKNAAGGEQEEKEGKKMLHKIWLSQETNYEIGSLFDEKHIFKARSPVAQMRTMKNAVELEGMRNSSIRDSATLVKFLFWLKNELILGHLVDENRAARQVNYYRGQLEKFVSPSFETISAADEHAALPHYNSKNESGKKLISKDSVYLFDSGGQYRDGTTDVTRTVCFADSPDEHFREMFTLVLRGHIDCVCTKFPNDSRPVLMDGITRAPLWAAGYEFRHGVGHGVGHFLNVHEIPPYIGYQQNSFGLLKGMVVTVEPGYYEQDKFGVRIENCYELVEAKAIASGATNFLAFEPLTLVPIQKSLIVRERLEQKHIDWLNSYHNRCFSIVGRYLQALGMQEEYNFLAEACTPF